MGKVIMNMKNLAVKAGDNATMVLVEEFKEINYALIYRGGDIPWIAAYGYDKATNSWAQGHYFESFLVAVGFIQNKLDPIPYARMSEIATRAIDGLFEADEVGAPDWLMEELDMTEEEGEYFGIDFENGIRI